LISLHSRIICTKFDWICSAGSFLKKFSAFLLFRYMYYFPLERGNDEARYVTTRRYVTNCYILYRKWRHYVTKIFCYIASPFAVCFVTILLHTVPQMATICNNCYIPFQSYTFSTRLWDERKYTVL
jgi:hypothetical protein